MVPDHVRALNMIDLEFSDQSSGSKRVVSAWKAYMHHLNDTRFGDGWVHRQEELLMHLLTVMAETLGLKFDATDLKTTSYFPRGYGENDEDWITIRQHLRQILGGRRSLPVEIRGAAGSPPPTGAAQPSGAEPPVQQRSSGR
jgi:Family of unknown function (DUF6680)